MRIFGITIPDNKKVLYSLPYIYGIGLTSSQVILRSAKVDGDKLAKDLTSEEINRIQKIIESSYKIEGDLRKEIGQNIKRLKEVGSWRGSRHSRRLPIHGRSKTNSRTARTPGAGPNVRKTMGSGRRSASEKT